jgi:hypothetical protein
MIYRLPPHEEPIDQGDIIDGCPVLSLAAFDAASLQPTNIAYTAARVIVLTQTCDFANQKVTVVTGAVLREAKAIVDQGILKASDVKGPVRAGRVYGWYFLPKNDDLGLPESIIDLRQLHTVRLDLLVALCRRGQRHARLQQLYREHLARHFGDTYGRIGLPEPYPTE